jgi:hypothetical protein
MIVCCNDGWCCLVKGCCTAPPQGGREACWADVDNSYSHCVTVNGCLTDLQSTRNSSTELTAAAAAAARQLVNGCCAAPPR